MPHLDEASTIFSMWVFCVPNPNAPNISATVPAAAATVAARSSLNIPVSGSVPIAVWLRIHVSTPDKRKHNP